MHGEAGETVGEQIRISVKYFARKRICGDGKILEYKFIVYFEDITRKFYAGTGGRKFDRRSYTCGLALRLIRGSSCERRGQAPSFLGSNDPATKMFHVGWSYPFPRVSHEARAGNEGPSRHEIGQGN